jgi:hypothetical protein
VQSAYQQRYLPSEGVWLLSAPDISFEIIVGGDSSSPSAGRLELLDAIGPRISSVSERAKAYLDEFVDRNRFAQGAEWFFEGLELGRNSSDAAHEFHCLFSIEGDTYGLWYVTYGRTAKDFFPVKFARRQQ